jgi:hypothetical protein
MANNTSNNVVSTCPLFPELENYKMGLDTKTGQLHIPGVFSIDPGSILPQGVGSGTLSTSYNVSYDANAWNSTALRNYEFEMHEKYPALQQAWDHYQTILRMCKSREEETGENRL